MNLRPASIPVVSLLDEAEERELKCLADWTLLHHEELPQEAYLLLPGVWIADVERSHAAVLSQCRFLAAVPGQRRRALLSRLRALERLVKRRRALLSLERR